MRLKTREWERKLGTVDVKKKAESGIIFVPARNNVHRLYKHMDGGRGGGNKGLKESKIQRGRTDRRYEIYSRLGR